MTSHAIKPKSVHISIVDEDGNVTLFESGTQDGDELATVELSLNGQAIEDGLPVDAPANVRMFSGYGKYMVSLDMRLTNWRVSVVKSD